MTVNFNSHAHVERDIYMGQVVVITGISTHTLTWSVTNVGYRIGMAVRISTHTLTWSVTGRLCTALDCKPDFNSHAHVERDKNSIRIQGRHGHFNSHAHVERDDSVLIFRTQNAISTHTLTWSVTY